MLAKLTGIVSERAVSKFRKRKRTFLCCVQVLHKAGVLCRSRATTTKKCTKKMLVPSCCFANQNLLLFCLSLCRSRRRFVSSLFMVVMQKFCYHGKVTSHFALFLSLFCYVVSIKILSLHYLYDLYDGYFVSRPAITGSRYYRY